jgi:putative oxidoreductase
MFLMAGSMKAFLSIAELSVTLPFAKDMVVLTRFIGVSEILGGIGIIAPAALRITPMLSVWAACGLAAIMILAVIFHISRGEFAALPTSLMLGLLAIFVAWGRSVKAPIAGRA